MDGSSKILSLSKESLQIVASYLANDFRSLLNFMYSRSKFVDPCSSVIYGGLFDPVVYPFQSSWPLHQRRLLAHLLLSCSGFIDLKTGLAPNGYKASLITWPFSTRWEPTTNYFSFVRQIPQDLWTLVDWNVPELSKKFGLRARHANQLHILFLIHHARAIKTLDLKQCEIGQLVPYAALFSRLNHIFWNINRYSTYSDDENAALFEFISAHKVAHRGLLRSVTVPLPYYGDVNKVLEPKEMTLPDMRLSKDLLPPWSSEFENLTLFSSEFSQYRHIDSLGRFMANCPHLETIRLRFHPNTDFVDKKTVTKKKEKALADNKDEWETDDDAEFKFETYESNRITEVLFKWVFFKYEIFVDAWLGLSRKTTSSHRAELDPALAHVKHLELVDFPPAALKFATYGFCETLETLKYTCNASEVLQWQLSRDLGRPWVWTMHQLTTLHLGYCPVDYTLFEYCPKLRELVLDNIVGREVAKITKPGTVDISYQVKKIKPLWSVPKSLQILHVYGDAYLDMKYASLKRAMNLEELVLAYSSKPLPNDAIEDVKDFKMRWNLPKLLHLSLVGKVVDHWQLRLAAVAPNLSSLVLNNFGSLDKEALQHGFEREWVLSNKLQVLDMMNTARERDALQYLLGLLTAKDERGRFMCFPSLKVVTLDESKLEYPEAGVSILTILGRPGMEHVRVQRSHDDFIKNYLELLHPDYVCYSMPDITLLSPYRHHFLDVPRFCTFSVANIPGELYREKGIGVLRFISTD